MPKSLTTSQFIEKAIKVHRNYFDYSQVLYTNMWQKVKIIDPDLGEFWQTPGGHLQGQGHPEKRYSKAAAKRRRTLEEFIAEAKVKHGNLYNYSKVNYTHCDSKVCIIDPVYGEFWQSPYQHLNSHGCPARTKDKKWEIHIDHIIPLSILHTGNRSFDKWFIDRPLYTFLNSDINLISVTAKFNRDKSDFILINDKTVSASSVRNNYDIIAFLIKNLLKVEPDDIIKADQQFVKNYFGL